MLLKWNWIVASMVVLISCSRTQELEAGELLGVQGHPGL